MQGAQLMEENRRLIQVIGLFFFKKKFFLISSYLSYKKMSLQQMEYLFSTQKHVLKQGQSFELINNICSSSDPQDNDSLDISLKLG